MEDTFNKLIICPDLDRLIAGTQNKKLKELKMPLKKVSSEEFIKIVKKETGLDLSKPSMTIHVGPYFEWDRERKDFKKPKVVVTRELGRKNKGDK